MHGMGVQKEGDTLADIGDPLLAWVSDWVSGHGGEATTFPGTASRGEQCPTCRTNNGPVHVHAKWILPDSGQHEHAFDVTIAESWWAEFVTPPSSSRISDWLPSLVWGVTSRGLIWFGLFLAAVVVSFAVIGGGTWTDAIAPALLIALSAALIVFLLAPALLVLGKIPPLSKYTKNALNFLILWVGDALVYEKSPTDTARAKLRVKEDLQWLGGNNRDVVIAAHSLGSLLVVDVLNQQETPHVTSLVTFGSAIRLLQRQVDRYVSRLDSACPGLGWVNLYDPLDFIAGPVIYRESFPTNLKVDNCRSVFQAHSSYPDNAEQFLMTLFRMITGPRQHGRDRELGDAIRSRHRRSLFRSAMIMSTAPALMGITLALLKLGWPLILRDVVNATSLSQELKNYFIAAVPDEKTGQLTSAVLLCLATAGVVLALLIWITRLYLAGWERRAEDLLSLRNRGLGPPVVPILLLLLMVAAVWLPPFLGAPFFNKLPQVNLVEGLAFELFPALAAVIVLGWIVRIRFKREVRAAVANGSRHPELGAYLGEALNY